MVFGGLSEQECAQISDLLNAYDILFHVSPDRNILKSNQESMQFNLRHLNAPSISTHVLAIEIDELEMGKMPKELKEKLLSHGIAIDIPQEFNQNFEHTKPCENPTAELRSDLEIGKQKLVGHNFMHQIFLALGAFIIYIIIKSFL